MIEASTLATVIERQIRDAVDQSIESYVEKTITHLTLDPAWVTKIENLINQNFSRKFSEKLSMLDFDNLVGSHIDRGFDRYQKKLLESLQNTGIISKADVIEIEISNDLVQVRNKLIAQNVDVSNELKVHGSLDVNNLCVRGSINTENRSWNELSTTIKDRVLQDIGQEWQESLVKQVLDLASTSGINFADVKLDGQPLVNGSVLNPRITDTKIERLGVLKDLYVSGHAEINETLNVSRRRVGINTTDPEMALSVWDEEITIIAGKLSSQKGFIGTARLTPLAIGINRTPAIEIDTDNLVSVKKLRIGQYRLAHEPKIPGYSGTRGDIVFNSDLKPDNSAFAWVCLGNFKWQPIKGL